MDGTRRPLLVPLTLLGQAPGCDIRLNADSVEPLHCAILASSEGPILRDLNSATGTRINGQPVTVHRLVSGDVLDIGVFSFTVALSESPTAEAPSADVVLMERDQQAVRIQAAAVAAQQAALTEEESRLIQQSTALTRQEAQLASHLQERQQGLDERQEELEQERAAFQDERTAARQEIEQERTTLVQISAEADQHRQKAVRERQHLKDLRRRLRRRWRQHWDAHEASLKKREAAVTAGLEQIQRERDQVRAFQERINGEQELSRQKLREDWQELGLEQQRLDEWINLEKAVCEREKQDLQKQILEFTGERQTFEAERQRWQQYQAGLVKEAEGLEVRIRNQRERLTALQRESTSIEARLLQPEVTCVPMSPALLSAAEVPGETWPERIRIVAGQLADQRAHLAEQWRRLLDVQAQWQEEHAAAMAELECSAAALAERDHTLQTTQRELEANRFELERRQEQLGQMRNALQGWQARLVLQEADWHASRDSMLDQVEARERTLATRSSQLEEIHQRRNQRRREEVLAYQQIHTQCEEARRQYAALWRECEKVRQDLDVEERNLSMQALALEQFRQELLARSPDSAKAESRIEKLRKQEVARLEQQARRLEGVRGQLGEERQRLDDHAALLREQEESLRTRQQALEQAIAEWEGQLAVTREEETRRQQELRTLRVQHATDERQLRQLREEIERVASLLIEEAIEVQIPGQQAA